MTRYCTVHVGDYRLGLDVETAHGLVRPVRITPVPPKVPMAAIQSQSVPGATGTKPPVASRRTAAPATALTWP